MVEQFPPQIHTRSGNAPMKQARAEWFKKEKKREHTGGR
jgi:hypothetical protein